MASQLAIEKAAQVWCRPATAGKVMDPDLCVAFAEALDEVWSRPWLGNATTEELLGELHGRVRLHGLLGYRGNEGI
jgi:hypothetical protein